MSENYPDLSPIRKLYDDSLEKHGATAAGVGWGDAVKHRIRFDNLAKLINVPGPVTVNDLGCGYGAFLEYLSENEFDVGEFRGYDISARMIDLARSRHPTFEWFTESRLDRMADYSFASGIFNVPMGTNEDVWRNFVEGTIAELARHSRKGFAFNLLSTYVDYRAPNLFYGDAAYYFDLCKRKHGKNVALLHDYPLYEWTLLVRM